MQPKTTWLLCAVLLSHLGCAMDEVQKNPPVPQDGGKSGGDLGAGQMPPPMVDPLPPSVCTDTVPVQGTAQAGASVVVFGGASSAVSTDAHPSTGRFCVDVPLVKDSQNDLDIHAQDPILGMSASVHRTVLQAGDCKDDVPGPTPDPPEPRNVALGAEAKGSQTPLEGNPGLMVDGNPSTTVYYRGCNVWFAYNGWVSIKLDQLYKLSKIRVHWRDEKGDGGDFATEYKVLISSMSDPGDPNLDNGYWTVVQGGNVTAGNGGLDEFPLSAEPLAQHVALFLVRDDRGHICEHFVIGEIEALDAPDTVVTPPTSQQNTCATIGS